MPLFCWFLEAIVHVDKSEMLLHDYYDFVSEDQQ